VFRDERVVAIVPARIGSKRLPRKNLQSVAGKPLIIWSLEAGSRAANVDRTVLSTDDDTLRATAERYGYTDIVVRPPHLSDDEASTASVIEHALEVLREQGQEFGYLVLLQPTSPLRSADHIGLAFEKMANKNARGAVSICQTEHPIEWMGKITMDGFLDSFFVETRLEERSQQLAASFQINGAIYIAPVTEFLEKKTLFLPNGMVALIMDRIDSIDVDDEYDLQLADWLLERRGS
jgi:CMP-N,N'-diacetyllegionaminic acid synthase